MTAEEHDVIHGLVVCRVATSPGAWVPGARRVPWEETGCLKFARPCLGRPLSVRRCPLPVSVARVELQLMRYGSMSDDP